MTTPIVIREPSSIIDINREREPSQALGWALGMLLKRWRNVCVGQIGQEHHKKTHIIKEPVFIAVKWTTREHEWDHQRLYIYCFGWLLGTYFFTNGWYDNTSFWSYCNLICHSFWPPWEAYPFLSRKRGWVEREGTGGSLGREQEKRRQQKLQLEYKNINKFNFKNI